VSKAMSTVQGDELRELLQEISDIAMSIDAGGQLLEINALSTAAQRYLDALQEGLLAWRFLMEKADDDTLEPSSPVLYTGGPGATEFAVELSDGQVLHFRGRFFIKPQTEGRQYEGYFINIHKETGQENMILNFESFFHKIDQMVLVVSLQKQILFANEQALEKLNYSLEELKTLKAPDLMPEDDSMHQAKVMQDFCNGRLKPCELTLLTRDSRPIRVRIRSHRGQWNKSPCVYCLAAELTEEDEIIQRVGKIFQKGSAMLMVLEADSLKVVQVNDIFVENSGYTKDEIEGHSLDELEILYPLRHYKILKAELKDREYLHEKEMVLKLGSGESMDVIFNMDRLQYHERSYYVIFMLPLGKHKAIQRILAAKARERRILLDNIRTQVWYLLDATTYGTVNRAHAEFLGLRANAMVYQPMKNVLPEGLVSVFGLKNFEDFQDTAEDSGQWLTLPSGEARCLKISRTPVRNLEGRIQYVVCSAEDVTREILDRRTIETREEEFRTLITQMAQGIVVFSALPAEDDRETDFQVTKINERFLKMTGYTEEEMAGCRFSALALEGADSWLKAMTEAAFTGVTAAHEQYYEKTKRWFNVTIYSPRYATVAVMLDDISCRKRISDSLYVEKERLKMTLLSVGDGIITTDATGKTVLMNPVAEAITGWHSAEAYRRHISTVLKIQEGGQKLDPRLFDSIMALKGSLELKSEWILRTRAGKQIPVEGTINTILDAEGLPMGLVIVFRNIAELREKQRKIEYLSFHDHLTGLYNRRFVDETIKRLDTRRNLPLTLMSLDVNGLKLTNDAFGHEMGDRLLRTVSEILKDTLRQDEIVGRMGGDEFMVVLPNTSETQAEQLKQRILAATEACRCEPLIVSLAIGHRTKVHSRENILEILRLADQEMYEDKLKNGKKMRLKTIDMVLKVIQSRYAHEQMYVVRVTQYAEAVARKMGLDSKEIENILIACELHEIGMIMLPEELINRKGPLTPEEQHFMELHTKRGYQILRSVDEYSHLAEYILHHHERWDGRGYPSGLKGEEIPLYSRIIAVASAYESMTSSRPHKRPLSREKAIQEIQSNSGTQFDPGVVKVFLECLTGF